MRSHLLLAALSLLAFALPLQAQDSLLKQVVFCHGLEDNQKPKDKAEFFMPEETVYVSVELKGRPAKGVVSCRFMIEKDLIAEAKIDVATVNSGVIASIGQSTFAGFNLIHEKPLPVGNIYSVELAFDGKPLGTFPFRIAPPKGALPSKLKSTTFVKEIDGKRQPLGAQGALAPEDAVVLQGVADLGVSTWLRATWLVDGKPAPQATRSFTLEENKEACDFFFSFRPDEGWPIGTHSVILQLNGEEVARPTFTVKEILPTRLTTEVGQLTPVTFSLIKTDPKTGARLAVGSFDTEDLVIIAEWQLKLPAKSDGVKFVWVIVEALDKKDTVLATAIPQEGVYRQLEASLTTKTGLPRGKYRVDLMLNDQVIDSRPFLIQ